MLGPDGRVLAPGEEGELTVDADIMFDGYLGDAAKTAASFGPHGFRTGDLGLLDDAGYVYVTGRARELIISGGANVYPAEVEGVLSGHPSVGDVAVIGIPDPEWGEQVKAIVELVDGVAPRDELAEELVVYCQDRMARYKCPRTVDFRDELPRTDGGKLYKRILREEYWADAERKV